MREARVRELASWNRSGARSPRTFVPDPRGGLLDARDAGALDVGLPLARTDHDVHELVGVEERTAVRLTVVDPMAVRRVAVRHLTVVAAVAVRVAILGGLAVEGDVTFRRVTVVDGLTVRPVTVRRVPSGAVHGVGRSFHAFWSLWPARRGLFSLPERHQQPGVQGEEDHHRAGDEPYRAERRHETDEERDAGALDHEHEHSTPSRTRPLASALTRPDECDALARRHDPATAPISFGIGQEVHVSFEVLDATTMRCSTRRHQER